MTTLSRRQLLTGGLLREEPSENKLTVKRVEAEWVQVGRVADFPPDVVTEVLVYGQFITVVSLAEGIQATVDREPEATAVSAIGTSTISFNGSSKKNQVFLPLRLTTGGWVQAEIGGSCWPPSAVLNILTGEQYSLN